MHGHRESRSSQRSANVPSISKGPPLDSEMAALEHSLVKRLLLSLEVFPVTIRRRTRAGETEQERCQRENPHREGE